MSVRLALGGRMVASLLKGAGSEGVIEAGLRLLPAHPERPFIEASDHWASRYGWVEHIPVEWPAIAGSRHGRTGAMDILLGDKQVTRHAPTTGATSSVRPC
jgi:hypothetical protein